MSGITDKLKQQIGVINAAAKIQFPGPPDYAMGQITGYLASNGTTSILDLQHYVNPDAQLDFYFDKKTAHVFTTSDPMTGADTTAYKDPLIVNPLAKDLFLQFRSDERNNFDVYLKFTSDGYPVFLVRQTDTGSDWVGFRSIAIFVGSVVVSFAFPALGAQIGNAVMGASAAAQYPAVASAIGQAAVNTALNGGNVQQGVTSALAGGAGGVVGGGVAGVSNAAIGSAAGAATAALLTGGDLQTAVVSSFIKSGIQGAAHMDLFSSDSFAASTGTVGDYDFGTADTLPVLDMGTGLPTGIDLAGGNYYPPGVGTNPFDFSNPSINAPVSPSGGGVNTSSGSDSGVAAISAVALAALKLLAPAIAVKAGLVTGAAGAQQVNSNGTVTTRSPTGQITITRPPAGVAYALPTGGAVINNGDGTYTTVSAQGVSSRHTYGATGNLLGNITPTQLAIGGAVIAAILLARK